MKAEWNTNVDEWDGSDALLDFDGFYLVGTKFKGKIVEPYTGKEVLSNTGSKLPIKRFMNLKGLVDES